MAQRIEVLPYDPEWHGLFRAIGMQLREALGTVARPHRAQRLARDHSGSTAVPGLATVGR